MNTVTAKKCFQFDLEKIKSAIRNIFQSQGFSSKLESLDSILLKPNLLGAYDPERSVTSHPIFVAAVIEILKDYNISISIFDNPGGSSKYKDVIQKTGMERVAKKYNVNLLEPVSGIKTFGSDPEYIISNRFLESEAIINLCKMKTHSYTFFTGAIKNTFGVVPGIAKANYHKLAPNPTNFAHYIVDIYNIVRDKIIFNLMDGIYGMDGDGPSNGKSKNFGVILGSENAIALDFVATRMMGYNPYKIPITTIAAQSNSINLDEIIFEGDFEPDFILPDVNIKTSIRTNLILRSLSAPFKNIIKKFFWTIPEFSEEKCNQCSQCVNFCPVNALSWQEKSSAPVIDAEKCILCLCCVENCPQNAVTIKKSFLSKILIS
ncbi:MAG: DUF362 domain-containing protein [Candidatus Cloacimonadota bacterium]|nr:DUF362 domain-containing protein [Candidatus Cloacimonadota bacterium]